MEAFQPAPKGKDVLRVSDSALLPMGAGGGRRTVDPANRNDSTIMKIHWAMFVQTRI